MHAYMKRMHELLNDHSEKTLTNMVDYIPYGIV